MHHTKRELTFKYRNTQNALIETIKDAGDLSNVATDIEYIHSVVCNPDF